MHGPRAFAEEPVLLVREAGPLVDGCHCVLLVAVKPDILSNVREVARLVLLHRFPQWLIAHLVEFDALWAMLQSRRWGRIQQGRHIVDRSVR